MSEPVYMWEVTLAIRHHGCPVSDTSAAHPTVHLQNLSKAEVADNTSKRLLCLRGRAATVDDFAADFRSHETVIRFERVSETNDGQQVYFTSEIEYEHENPSMAGLIRDHGCYQHNSVTVQEGIESWLIYSEEKSPIHSLITKIEEAGNDLTLYRSIELDRVSDTSSIESATLVSQLTDRQLATFKTALRMGYYDPESETVMDDIAEVMNVHQSTVWEHLNNAENTILRQIGTITFPGDLDHIRL
jgi:predicted DNA binding protein